MKPAAIYVRVSTADQHVESQLYDLRELAGTAWLGSRARVSRQRNLREKSETSGAGRTHRGCAAQEILCRARRCVRPGREKREALPASHGRVRQSGRGFHIPARERRHERPDGTTFLDPHRLNCRTRIGLDTRTSPRRNAQGEAGRCADRACTNES